MGLKGWRRRKERDEGGGGYEEGIPKKRRDLSEEKRGTGGSQGWGLIWKFSCLLVDRIVNVLS